MDKNEKIVNTESVPPDYNSAFWVDIQANYSAMMYILTEQQALIGTLLDQLLENGLLNEAQLNKVTGVYGNQIILDPVYNEMYQRFANYFMRVKEVLEHPEDYQPETPFPKGENDNGDGDNDSRGPSDGGRCESTETPDSRGV